METVKLLGEERGQALRAGIFQRIPQEDAKSKEFQNENYKNGTSSKLQTFGRIPWQSRG